MLASSTFPPPGTSTPSGSETTEPRSRRPTASSAQTLTKSISVTSAPTEAASTTLPCTSAPTTAIAIISSTFGERRRSARYASWKSATLIATHAQASPYAIFGKPTPGSVRVAAKSTI